MSLSVLTRGGASGGASASIFVTGLGLSENYVVTAVKDGKTVQGKWAQKLNPECVVPDGYTQLEYIESTGTQYINTGVLPTTNLRTSLKLKPNASAMSEHPVLGTSWNSDGYFLMLHNNQFKWHSRGDYKSVGNPILDSMNTLEVWPSGAIINGNTYTLSGSKTDVQNPIYLFAEATQADTKNRGVFSLYSVTMRDGEDLVRDFVPAKRNSDGVVGLYDLVTNEFYTNNGTGEFIAGTEVPQYISCHLISPIKSLGMWTVTVTNGEDTATQDVLVDVITEYEVKITFNMLYLYDEGDSCEYATGGWEKNINAFIGIYSSATGDVEFLDDSVYLNSSSGIAAVATTKKKIDISNYSKMKVLFGDISGFDNNVYMTELNTGNFETTATAQIRSLSTSSNTIMEVDISQYSGSFYFSFDSHTGRWAFFKKLWLEK